MKIEIKIQHDNGDVEWKAINTDLFTKKNMEAAMIQLKPTDLWAVEVPEDSCTYVIDNAMQYLIFKVPNYKNWITDKDMSNPFRLQKVLDKIDKRGDPDYVNSGLKLPDGKWSLMAIRTDFSGVIGWHESNGQLVFGENKIEPLLQENGLANFKKLLIIKPI